MNLLNTKVVMSALGIVAMLALRLRRSDSTSLMPVNQTYLVWFPATMHLG
jgi:hypothetical protein